MKHYLSLGLGLIALGLSPLSAQNAANTVATAATATSTTATAPPPTASAGTTSGAPASPTTTTTSTAPGTMSTIVVTGAAEGSVLPSDQPVSSVFGSDISLQDTPRSVTVLSPELLKAYNIEGIQDLTKTAPSAYLTDQFGGYSTPNIRGLEAETFINGLQATERTDGPPTSFNSVESAQIVNGPASSVYGPTGYVGGYVNYVTKTPYFDAWHSDTSFSYGSWDEKKWTEDFGAPIIPGVLAFRASYEGIDAGSYYNNVETKEQDGFFALSYKPSDVFHVDFNTEFQDIRFDEVTGYDRPTQDLISNHNYATGPLLFGFSALAPPINEEHISDSAGEISPQDSDYGKIYNAQLVETYDAGDGLSIVNRSMYEYEYLRNTELAQYYANLLNSNIVQDRFEIHLDFDEPIGTKSASAPADPKATVDDKDIKTLAKMEPFLDFKHSMIAGLAFKSVSLNDYQGYDNEVLNGTDLSTGTYPQASTEGGLGSGFENVLNIPGTNLYGNPGGNYPTANNPFGLSVTGSENEEAEEGSAFFQDNITFTPQWSLIFGTRVDAIFDNVADSLAPAGVIPAHDNTTEIEPSTNISLDYKPAPWITNYLTFSWSESYTGNTGGGFAYFTPQNTLSGYGYHLQNFLYEGGSKADLLDHTLFLTADGYYQTHYETTALGATTQVRVVGSELQQTYQPNKNFYINLNESYMMATLINPAGEDTYESAFITNPNSPGIDTFAPSTPSNYRESGLPNLLLSGLATYKWDCGVGVSLSYTITDPIPIAEINSAWIPWQYQIDASLFYDAKNWGAKLELYNITDQHNWSSGGYIAQTGNDLITLQEPFHMEGTISYKF